MKLSKRPRLSLYLSSRAAALLSLPVVLAASLSQATSADTSAQLRLYRVHYDPQSLSTAEGREVLKRRIVRAARIVCGDPRGSSQLRPAAYKDCVRDATDRAVAEVMARTK
jgi:UrcA family protein